MLVEFSHMNYSRVAQASLNKIFGLAFHPSCEMHPAGDYKIAQDEEPIEGLSWLAYRRVATYIHLPSIAQGNRLRRIVRIEPTALDVQRRMRMRSCPNECHPRP